MIIILVSMVLAMIVGISFNYFFIWLLGLNEMAFVFDVFVGMALTFIFYFYLNGCFGRNKF